jgi:hypothetical protein
MVIKRFNGVKATPPDAPIPPQAAEADATTPADS